MYYVHISTLTCPELHPSGSSKLIFFTSWSARVKSGFAVAPVSGTSPSASGRALLAVLIMEGLGLTWKGKEK